MRDALAQEPRGVHAALGLEALSQGLHRALEPLELAPQELLLLREGGLLSGGAAVVLRSEGRGREPCDEEEGGELEAYHSQFSLA